ncbi:GNAT family N-acetyltransferase [Phytomonospora sp. NPDC050363]|uniref:GNAT family N-acetyltransferase n=1 Tax=Phytomonospora sp. NPDC050363 TaxID=3155642 RepID=UPI0033D4E83D
MDIAPLDLRAEPNFAAFLDLHRDSHTADRPESPHTDPETLRALLTHLHPGKTSEYHGVWRDGRLVAAALMFLPGLDNRDVVELEGSVRPSARRTGLGRALFAHVARRARELGRDVVLVNAVSPIEGSPLARSEGPGMFCAAMGMRAVLGDVRSRLDVPGEPPAADPVPGGYRLVQWTDGLPGDPPAEYLEDLAELATRMSTDSPQGDLDTEVEVYDPARILAWAATARAAGRTEIHSGVVDEATGRLVGWTALSAGRDTEHATQGYTIVAAEHRGHGLGRVLKTANLAQAKGLRPHLRTIDTYNAEVNGAMRAVNASLGFTDLDRTVHFRARL